MPRPWHIAALLVSLAGTHAHAQTAADTTHRSPVLAGVASYLLPGVGSWYAGNDQHALTHGAIALGLGVTGTVMTAGRDCYDLCVPPTLFGALVVLGYLTNDIWSTVTAVRDAHAHNDRAQRLRTGRIEVAPTLRIVPPAGDVARWRVEMRVLRVGL